MAECAQAIYDTIGDPSYTQCSEMISGYEQHNPPDDETQCFCFSQILADNDLQIYVDSVQRPFTQFDLDCEFIYPQYNIYMQQYSDYCRCNTGTNTGLETQFRDLHFKGYEAKMLS